MKSIKLKKKLKSIQKQKKIENLQLPDLNLLTKSRQPQIFNSKSMKERTPKLI